ncbi:hypothetical protein [Gelidibacter pelagius]|uniref:Uncharacterized protein n=1 Tax=Gelidibacter pelagius TaxID=2819985 RepID=A0ABS3SVN7_9FLAO|nr:hypothetical protein [Gelidibacter pelagius]MBO3099780.1 hypothetical protein [Gelidibacter pelagius]
MKSIKDIKLQPKWFISAALIFIAVLGGVLGQQKSIVPNQEIVVQFANENISLNDAKHTITIVEKELHRIGVSHIQISGQEDGRLVISYYSDTNVEGIKKMLSEQNELALGLFSSEKKENPLKFPTKKESIAYNLDVYEIQQGQPSNSDLGGKCALELKTKHHRFVNYNFYIPSYVGYPEVNNHTLKANFSFQRYAAITKEYCSHKIPEVRAGPLS